MTRGIAGRPWGHLVRWLAAGALLLAVAAPTLAASLCAVVKIEIRQELTFERQGFEAHLRISNALDTLALQGLAVEVLFQDEDGNPVLASSSPQAGDAAFFIRIWSMSGVDAVDGTGTVGPGTSADIRWLIVPAPGSGGRLPSGKLYFVGARVSYTLGGEAMQTEVAPDFIYVQPLPRLSLDYFLTRDVLADDPFTDQIEPIEPFTLGVRVRNNGEGTARAVKIESAQPKIVENEQGLLIDFRIIGSTVNDLPVTPSLLVGLGDIAPTQASVGRWIMETTLAGQFVDFTAEFSHADALGGDLTSILEAAATHRLVRDVLVDLPGRDGTRDFLALDGDILRVYESHGLDTAVTDQSARSAFNALADGRYELAAPATAGFMYVKLPDPFGGHKQVAAAIRADGKSIRAENVWFSKERDRAKDTWVYFFNLFDTNTDGRYLLALEDSTSYPRPPVLQFIPDRRTHEGGQLAFVVEASDPNLTVPAISAAPLPAGATWTNETNGGLARWVFDWTPGVGQAGPYDITFTATDGVFETAQAARVTVCPLADTDCDGMADAWELRWFGSLERDGTGDFDGDGFTDLDEFRKDSDPTRKDAPSVPEIIQPADGARVVALQPLLEVRNSTHAPSAAVTYSYEVYGDAGLTGLVTSVALPEQVATTKWVVDTALADNQWYWWRVRACAQTLCSEWANARLLVNTVNDPPGPFHLSQPADGAEVGTTAPMLAVTNALDPDGDPVSYRFEVYEDGILATRVAVGEGIAAGLDGTTTWTLNPPLRENTWYYWRVIAGDPFGADRVCADYGSFFVNTVDTPPGPPGIVSPADGATVTQSALSLDVGNALDPDDPVLDYRFELDRVATFDSAEKRSSGPIPGERDGTTAWAVTGLVENATYFWRAQADDGLAQSDWVQAHFLVNARNEPPTLPTVQNPGDGAWVNLIRPRLVLNPAIDPDGDPIRYRFELYGDAALTTKLGENAAAPVEWQVDFDLPDNTWQFWRARAEDDHGLVSDWTAAQRFFVNDNGFDDPPTMTLVQPAEDVQLSAGQVRLAWVDADPDSNARIRLFYARQGGTGPAVTIADNLLEDPNGEADAWLWDIAGVPAGTYVIGALIEDATSRVSVQAPGTVTIGALKRGGITVTRTSQPNTTEAGVSSGFTVTLDSAPTANVVVPLRTSDTTEGQVSTTALTFTPGNWSLPQSATVTGVDDCAPDGNVAYQLLVGPAVTGDPAYDGIEPPPLALVNLDNDAPGGHPTLHICNYTLVDKQRYGRLDYDYRFRVQLTNVGGTVSGAVAILGSTNPVTTVVDGQVSFGSVGAGATVLSNDTFTIRQNRSYPFDPAALRWQVSPQP